MLALGHGGSVAYEGPASGISAAEIRGIYGGEPA